MTIKRVAVTGGNGKIGKHIITHLNDHGYHTVNIARGKRREEESDEYITTDLLDAGEVYGAFAKSDVDAVIHMGTIPRPDFHAEHRVYESNVMSTMHVLEAGQSLGLESVCIASSINAMGSEHQERIPDIRYLPVDEAHPCTPDDIYGTAKHAMEVTADGVGRRPEVDMTIASLRYPWVTTESELHEYMIDRDRSLEHLGEVHPATGRDVLFSYLHIDDGAAVARKAIEAEFDGHEVFWTVAADTTAAVPTDAVVNEFFSPAEVRGEFEGYETLFDLTKASKLLDWQPEHSWRRHC